MKKILAAALLLILALPVAAQITGALPYAWDAADLALAYPAGWDEPLEIQLEDRMTLQLAQVLVDAVDVRPPGVPYITLTVIPPAEDDAAPDLSALLQQALRDIDIRPTSEQPVRWLGVEGVAVRGSSADGLLYGVGQAVNLPVRGTVMIVGRGLVEQQDIVARFYNLVLSSVVLGANVRPTLPQYGVLWRAERTLADGEQAFLDLTGLAYDAPNQRLYALDQIAGVIQLDASTGAVEAIYPFSEPGLPSDIAVTSEGRVFVTDTGCGCLWVLNNTGQWIRRLDDFGPDAPLSLAADFEGRVYITDVQEEGVVVRVVDGAQVSAIPMSEDVIQQPLLTVDLSGRVLALVDHYRVLRLGDEGFMPDFDLTANLPQAADITVDLNNQLLVVTPDQGIVAFDMEGNEIDRIGRVITAFSQPGDLVTPTGVAAGADGTVFVADGDGFYGAVSALSTLVEPGRLGAARLIPQLEVQGSVSTDVPSQTWTFEGAAGERVTLTAVALDAASGLNLALRLIAPNGREEAYNDDHENPALFHPFDAQIAGLRLAQDGVYTIAVERVDGGGAYRLGLSKNRSFEIAPDAETVFTGQLSAVFGVDRWVFRGRAGQRLTITLNAESGTLDPALRLLDGSNNLLLENDDAEDPQLGPDAQLVEARLPASGTYVIEAARFSGEGRYRLTITPVEG